MMPLRFDPGVAEQILTYARLLTARGYVHNHLRDVEQDVGPVGGFIQDTNAIMMENHGVTTLGATPPEAYHRLNTLAAEIRRVMQAEMLARAAGTEVAYLAPDAVDFMYRNANDLQYASRARQTSPMQHAHRAECAKRGAPRAPRAP